MFEHETGDPMVEIDIDDEKPQEPRQTNVDVFTVEVGKRKDSNLSLAPSEGNLSIGSDNVFYAEGEKVPNKFCSERLCVVVMVLIVVTSLVLLILLFLSTNLHRDDRTNTDANASTTGGEMLSHGVNIN